MKISIDHHADQFNVSLASSEGREPFLTIKGCRVRTGSNGEFLSLPARKQENGKWWSHVYASEEFGAAVLAEYHKTIQGEARQAPRQKAPRRDADDYEGLPF